MTPWNEAIEFAVAFRIAVSGPPSSLQPGTSEVSFTGLAKFNQCSINVQTKWGRRGHQKFGMIPQLLPCCATTKRQKAAAACRAVRAKPKQSADAPIP
jgi:hypothetical protein